MNFLLPDRGFGEGWGGVKNLRLLQGFLYLILPSTKITPATVAFFRLGPVKRDQVKLASLKLAPCKLACRQPAPLKIAPDKLASLKFAPCKSTFAKLAYPRGMLIKSSPAHSLVYHNKLTCWRLAAITNLANPKISFNETAPKVTDFLLFTFYNFKRFLISTSTPINFFRHSTPRTLSGNFLISPYLHNTL